MLGADVGTALMARVLTLDLSWLSPLLILFGVPLFLTRKQTRGGQVGRTIIGLGLILLALHLIVEAAQPMMQGAGVRVVFGALTGDTMLDALVGAGFAMPSVKTRSRPFLVACKSGDLNLACIGNRRISSTHYLPFGNSDDDEACLGRPYPFDLSSGRTDWWRHQPCIGCATRRARRSGQAGRAVDHDRTAA
jgi:hypothetical protein